MVECQLPKLITRVRFPSLAPFWRGRRAGLLGLFAGLLLICGCVTVESPDSAATSTSASTPTVARGKGIYHKVKKGETLWRIAKLYNVGIDRIIAGNNIPDAAHVENNQLIFIPGAETVQELSSIPEDRNKDEFAWPVNGKVSQYFGQRKGSASSRGIRINSREGDPVKAARQGKVIFSDYLQGYAYTLILDHYDGFCSVYSQNEELLVGVGDVVQKGQDIARVGHTGNTAYLHFEIRKHGRADNPLYYLPN